MAITLVGKHTTKASTGTAASDTHGLTILTNDVVVCLIHANLYPNATSVKVGAPAMTKDMEDQAAGSNNFAIFSRVAGSSEPLAYEFTLANSDRWTVQTRVYRGVDTSSIWDVAPSAANYDWSVSGTTATAPSITTNYDGSLVIAAFLSDFTDARTWSGVTNSFADELEDGGSGVGMSTASYAKTQAAAGAVGATSADLDTSDDWLAMLFALRAATSFTHTETGAATLSVSAAGVAKLTHVESGAAAFAITASGLLYGAHAWPMAGAAGFAITAAMSVPVSASAPLGLLDVDDALWQIIVGSDASGWRDVTAEASIPTYSSVRPGGSGSASFTVPVDAWDVGYNELRADSEVRIRYDAEPVWSGFIMPRDTAYQGGSVGEDDFVTIECAGYLERLKRRADYCYMFTDTDLSQWYNAEWDNLTPGIQITQFGDLKFAAASGSVFPADSFQSVWYHLHGGLSTEQDIYGISFDWTSLGTMTLEVFETDVPSVTSGWRSLGQSVGGATNWTPAGIDYTCAAGTRGLAIKVGYPSGATALPTNEWVKLTKLIVRGQQGDVTLGVALAGVMVGTGLADFYSSDTLPYVTTPGGPAPPVDPPVDPPAPPDPPTTPYGTADYYQETFDSYVVPSGMNNKVFEDCTFIGGIPGDYDYSGVFTINAPCHDLVFYNCHFQNTIGLTNGNNGIKIVDHGRDVYNIIFDTCDVEEMDRFGFECISRPSSGTLCYSGIQLLDCTFEQQGGEVVSFDGQWDSTGCVVHGCDLNSGGMNPTWQAVRGWGSGLEVNGPHNFTITDNTIRRCYHGLLNFQQNDGDTTDCGWVVTGNLIDGDTLSYGPASTWGSDLIGCNKVRGGTFTGNTIKNHADYSTHAIACNDCHDMDWSPNTWSDDRGVPDYAPNAYEDGLCEGNVFG